MPAALRAWHPRGEHRACARVGRAWLSGIAVRRAGLSIDPSPAHPDAGNVCLREEESVSRPIEGLGSFGAVVSLRMQLGRRLAARRFASARRRGAVPGQCSGLSLWQASLDKREADPLARRRAVHSVRTAPGLSSPSMGRDTLLYPIQQSRQRQDGQGLGSMARPARRGRAGMYTKVPGAARTRCADELLSSARGIPAVQARDSDARRRRRAKPLPVLPHARRPNGTPGAQRPATAPQACSAAANQFFNRYPVLKIHATTPIESARKPSVIAMLTPTLTSPVP